jgi:hypothetical protein
MRVCEANQVCGHSVFGSLASGGSLVQVTELPNFHVRE